MDLYPLSHYAKFLFVKKNDFFFSYNLLCSPIAMISKKEKS